MFLQDAKYQNKGREKSLQIVAPSGPSTQSGTTLGINKVIQYIIQNIKQPKHNLTANSHKMHLCFD